MREEIELDGAIAGECSLLALLRAFYAAERAAMAGNAIRKAFTACGAHPFSKTIIKEFIKENAGRMLGKATEGKVKSTALSVAQKRKAALSSYEKKNKKRKAKARKSRVCDPKDIAIEGEKGA